MNTAIENTLHLIYHQTISMTTYRRAGVDMGTIIILKVVCGLIVTAFFSVLQGIVWGKSSPPLTPNS